eukprot:TRINITY_DN11435_c0_g1_i1.p1 TRINITY_DN11435_c0_g1~~TRINITY_DN11435_c0_g1_i1.p1  ORF type:complete len:491 (-),score=91.13 TRINITY_DN11435_c0_g1_i1:97-1404(-)
MESGEPTPSELLVRRIVELQVAKARLSLGMLPYELPGRQKELERLQSEISACVEDRTGKFMFVSGFTGAGKTAVMTQILHNLMSEHQRANYQGPQVFTAYINCAQFRNPTLVINRLLQALESKLPIGSGQFRRVSRHYQQVERYFETTTYSNVLVLDEMDILASTTVKSEKVLYKIAEWTRCYPLVVVGVSNLSNLKEKILAKIDSRLGISKFKFKAYDRYQIEAIVRHRLGGLNPVMSADAIALVAGKIASVSGDMRKVLTVCKNSIEVLEKKLLELNIDDPDESSVISKIGEQVSTQVIRSILGERSSPYSKAIRSLSIHEKLFLYAIYKSIKRVLPQTKTTFGKVVERYRSWCNYVLAQDDESDCVVLSCPTVAMLHRICEKLVETSLILAGNPRDYLIRTIELNIDGDELISALEEDSSVESVINSYQTML